MFNNDETSGGFSSTGFNSPFRGGSSQTTEKSKSKPRHFLPVMTNFIGKSSVNEEGVVTFNDIEVHHIIITGVVVSIKSTPTRADILIADHSGESLEIRSFQEQNELVIKEKEYYKVMGQVRGLSGKVSVVAFSIRPITDCHEYVNHLLECINASMLYERMSQGDYGLKGLISDNPSNNSNSHGNSMSADDKLQDSILSVVRANKDEDGIHINQILTELNDKDRKDLLRNVEFLSSEGHIYCTIDDDHFQATDDGM